MNNKKNELETVIAPGTNQVLTAAWQLFIVNNFKSNRVGLHAFGDRYITVQYRQNQLWAIVHEIDLMIQTKTGYQPKHIDGFSYRLD